MISVPANIRTVLASDREPAPVLVSVFLRGGADGLHLVPPVDDDAYHRSRPTIAVKKQNALKLDGFFGLHPELAPLMPIYQAGELAIVHQCGTEENSRSHFEAEDYLQHGGLQGGGWIGRWLHHTRTPADGPLTAVSIDSTVSETLRGAAAVALQSLEDFRFPDKSPAMRSGLEKLYAARTGPLGNAGRETLQALDRMESLRNSDPGPQHGATYANDEFSSGLRLIARLIRGGVGLRAATIELGGWDSHFTQLTLTSGLMPRLAAGLSAFHRDLGSLGTRVHTVVTTEFGRRVAENVSAGTDHGRAGVLFAMGGGVRGGRVLSDWGTAGLAAEVLEGPGDVPVRHLCHQALGAVMKRMTPAVDLGKVFPDLPPGTLEI